MTNKECRERERLQVQLTRQALQQTSAMLRMGLDPVSYVAIRTNTSLARAETLIELAREQEEM